MKPNVILIISDQWNRKIADGSGNNLNGIETKALDSLARDGIRFENNYSSFPLCCPARSSMFTGCMPHLTGSTDNDEIKKQRGIFNPNQNLVTMGEVFKKNGYETAYFGKEHASGFGWKGMDDLGTLPYSGGGWLAEGSLYDQIFTNDGVNFLKKKHENPFYMVLSLINPHDICKALGGKVHGATICDGASFCVKETDKYLRGQERLGLPSNFDAPVEKGMIPYKDFMFEDLKDLSESDWRRRMSVYGLLMEKTDMYVQNILDEVKKQGLEDDTIIVFTTDHGDMMSSHKIIAKTNMYEESALTHLIIKYKGRIKEGTVNRSALSNTIDLMPTILDLAGLEVPSTCQGHSLKKECLGEKSGNFKYCYSENFYSRMVRYKNYKFIMSDLYDEKYDILFDLEKDPEERVNVYNKPGYENISKELKKNLTEYIEKENISTKFKDMY